MNNKLKPAIMAGGILGLLLVLTVLLSVVVGVAGCCNCLWPIAAGALGTMFYVKSSTTPATPADGAMIGALAGLVGGIIYLVVGIPISYLIVGTEAMDAQLRQISPDFPLTGMALMLIGGLVGVVIFVVLATVGGLIGVPIFEKRKDGNVPPPPQDFAGGAGGFGSV
jgi:hypothetical protein